ncbi:MAG: NADH-quinone oxidoreductase subunit N [Acidimicrobiia bacterium]|nr:NADH-quinone oxidoreductase subunit N [Acidimicrobiia bacterium]
MISPSFNAIVPMLCATAGALVVMLAESWRARGERMPLGVLGGIALSAAGIALALLWDQQASSFGVIVADNFGIFVSLVVVVAGLVSIAFSSQVLDRDGIPRGEYYALLLFAIVGMMMMATANDLLVVFIGLEVMSVAVYVLTGIRRDDPRGVEGAFKYFLLGAFASAFLLYGVAFTFGLTGTTRLDGIGQFLAARSMSSSPMVLLAMGLLLVGFAFKISAVPFHMWTPDAYEGAPAVVTGFMSTGVKAAAFAAFTRVFLSAFEPFSADWAPLVWYLAIATMVLGTVVGVAQHNLKRMLAYSSIAHGGYLLVGLVAANQVGKEAILFYLAAYAVTNLAAFGAIALLGTADRANDTLQDYRGLWQSRPMVAGVLTVALLSLGGLPPTAGFIGKWYIFSAAVSAGYYGLAIAGVLTSVISVFFYLRVVVMMYMTEPAGTIAPPVVSRAALATLAVTAAIILYLGVLPTALLDLAAASIDTIF